MLLVSLATANAKCNWDSVKLQQWNEGNFFRWELTGVDFEDTCFKHIYILYNIQTKESDTFYTRAGIIPEFGFWVKGKYKMYAKVWNKCKNCDTTLVSDIDIIYFNNSYLKYGLKSTRKNTCLDSIAGEMSLGSKIPNDTCWNYYSYIFNGPLLDSLSEKDWNTMSDMDLEFYYGFDDSDLLWFKGPNRDARFMNYKFPKDGHYLIATQWHNKCLNQDTLIYSRITIKCNTSGVDQIIKPEPKLIGTYDMLGRPVEHIRKEEIMIYLYDDGTKKKIIKQ